MTARFWPGLRGLVLGCAAALVCAWPMVTRASSLPHPAQPPAPSAPVSQPPATVAFLGDPQLGYTSLEGDLLRLGRVLRAAEATPAHALIIAGDLTQDHNLVQRWLFSRALRDVRVPVHLVPGNHDVDDVASLELFRRQFGADYSEFMVGQVAFLLLNSETARSTALSASEYARQWTFIEQTLRKRQQSDQKTVLVMHRPPFVRHESERATQANWPPESRRRLLKLCRETGVTLILAGHLHRTHVVQTQDGIQIRVLPGSARSFDRSAIGFELLSLNQTSTNVRFIQVGPPPAPLFSVPGLRGWTPRLFDFSVRHWLFTALFGLAGASALIARRRVDAAAPEDAAAPAHRGLTSARLFAMVGWLMLFYAVNMQLDLDELVLETGRILAKQLGVSSVRHWITGSGLVILVAGATMSMRGALRAKRPWRDLATASACMVPTVWFILSAISHHHLRMLFDQLYWDVLNLLAVGIITYAALSTRRPLKPTQRLA